MIALAPCTRCARHVSATDVQCPFCGYAIASSPERNPSGGRFSRAAVFAGAIALAGCGGKKTDPKKPDPLDEERPYIQNHPCSDPDPVEIARLEKARDEAKTDEERRQIEQQLDRARMPMCAPYGAPPARRRLV